MRHLAPCLLLAIALTGGPALAQTLDCSDPSNFPCGLQIERAELVKAPPIFRVQARVAQLLQFVPLGVFDKVVVNVMHGTDPVCTEIFESVTVHGSVLNLLVGPEMDCAVGGDLGHVLETRDALSLRLCFPLPGAEGVPDSACLDDIALGTTPNAVKASVARHAWKAHQVERAGQAHQAQRFTADATLDTDATLRTGYFELRERTGAELASIYPAGATPDPGGVVLEWAPVDRPSARTLQLGAKETNDTDTATVVRLLRRLLFAALRTWTRGDVQVTGHPSLPGLVVERLGAAIHGLTELGNDLRVTGDTSTTAQIHVTDPTHLHADLVVDPVALPAQPGNLTVAQGSNVVTTTVATGVKVQGGGMSTPGAFANIGRLDVDALTVSQGVDTRVLRVDGSVRMAAPTAGLHTVFQRQGSDLVINPNQTLQILLDGDMHALFGATFQGVLKYGGILTTCQQGFLPDAAGVCRDVDECALGSAGCAAGCVNTNGSFVCAVQKHIFVTVADSWPEAVADMAFPACAQQAAAAGYGTAIPWLGFTGSAPCPGCTSLNVAALANTQYVRPDGTVVADDLADLLDGSLDAPINQTAAGLNVGDVFVWTGLNPAGVPTGVDCKSWNSYVGLVGSGGKTGSTDAGWTAATSTASCHTQRGRAYCIEL